jgi:hypothetical protein
MILSQIFLNKEGEIVDKHVGILSKEELELKLKEIGITNVRARTSPQS